MRSKDNQAGFAMITTVMLLALLATLILGYFTLTGIELTTTRATMNSTRGFYAAEAGLNLRADSVRQIFQGYNRPAGTAPVATSGQAPCQSGSGNGDFACVTHALSTRDVKTYIDEVPGNPTSIVIPRGEPFQNLHAQEYGYTVGSLASGRGGDVEALLQMKFKSRLVPMFQFAVFYNKDLEILPGPSMMLAGPVHTNGDL